MQISTTLVQQCFALALSPHHDSIHTHTLLSSTTPSPSSCKAVMLFVTNYLFGMILGASRSHTGGNRRRRGILRQQWQMPGHCPGTAIEPPPEGWTDELCVISYSRYFTCNPISVSRRTLVSFNSFGLLSGTTVHRKAVLSIIIQHNCFNRKK